MTQKLDSEKMTGLTKYIAVETLTAAVTTIFSLIMRNGHLAFSFTMTAIFFLPALKNGSVDAGFLYTGDILGFYLPSLAKTHALISSLNFIAIDFSLFNGSSDFFLAPNFFAYHPLVVIYSLLIPAEATTLQDLGHFLVIMLAAHLFLACYFSLKLFTRFFSFEFGAAALIATVFAFNVLIVGQFGEPQFAFCATIIPWVVYGALSYSETPNLKQLIFASLAVMFGFLGGYIPLGVACLALSVLLVAVKLLVIDDSVMPLDKRIRLFFIALLPYICASLIVGPYLYSVYQFANESPSSKFPSLFFSAHQLAELPQSLLRLISTHFSVPGPFYEFSLAWGFIAIIIAALFLSSPKIIDALTPQEWKIFKASALIYFATVLAIFGEHSVVSDLVYYLVPQIGKMHIYQRFLLPAHLLFAVMVALMLKAIVQVRPPVASRAVLTIFAFATLSAAYLVAYNPTLSQEIGLNNYLIFELLLGFLFACALIVPGKVFVYSIAIVLFYLPALGNIYGYSHSGNTFQEQRKKLIVALLDEAEKNQLVSYLKRFGDKAVTKYVDITPLWNEGYEPFPKSFPYFVLNKLQLSSYHGFNFYLSTRADYMRRMPVVGSNYILNPDWEWIKNTGADFAVTRESDVQGGALGAVFAKTKKEDLYKLPNNVVIIPIRNQMEKVLLSGEVIFDNGYFKILPTISGTNGNLINIALGKSARQSSDGGGDAGLAVDGNTDGDFKFGSVTHTGRDANAWLEIDLGRVETIDSIRVWNRTDCCGDRLHDYWIFISEAPFLASDTAAILQTRPATWSQVNFTPNPTSTIKTGSIRGRYVRIQLDGTQPIEERYLHLAEVEVFRSDTDISKTSTSVPNPSVASDLRVRDFTTNHANYLRLDLESSVPVTVEYLFWNNPRLNYYLNGQRATVVESKGLRTINVPTGRNTIEIQYRHWPLIAFWVLYTMYGVAYLWALTTTIIPIGVWRKLFRRVGRATDHNI